MLHPDVILKKSSISGRGLFAKKRIPKGTVVWRSNKDVRIYKRSQYNQFSKKYKTLLRRYSYEDAKGNLIYCIDNAKYWNHSCDPNTSRIPNEAILKRLNLGEIDIAIKDIEAGGELTYDYALLAKKGKKIFKCNCDSKDCRGMIKGGLPNSRIVLKLDFLAKEAMKNLFKVKQPLLKKNERSSLGLLLDLQKRLKGIQI